MTYYFDALPLHPGPESLESLTSYLMRLGELNGISSIDGISTLSFPNQDRRITRDIADYQPVSFGHLMTIGVCNEEALRKTTFFHVTTKFGRSVLPQPTSRFLSGCISLYLRYCPQCLAQQHVKYYQLSWRFLAFVICYKHKCRLLETCGHCSALIPLFTSPFKLGYCPKCQKSLEMCVTTLVTDQAEIEVAMHTNDDIVFLLTPQSWERDGSRAIGRVGRRFMFLRQKNRLTAAEIAKQLGVTLTVVEGIERGDFQRKGATLESYFKYAHYLQISLKEVFIEAIHASDCVLTTPLPLCPTCQQNEYVTRAGYNRSGSQRYQCQQCHHSFTSLLNIHR